MMNVPGRPARLRRRACQFPVISSPVISAAVLSSAAMLPGSAWAACVQTPNTVNVLCDGNSPAYSNTGTSLQVTADSSAVVVGPLVIGSGTAAAPATLTVASGGNIEGSSAAATVQFGDYARITNNGTITASSSTGSAILTGVDSSVTNNGTLTAIAGTAAVAFTSVGTASTNGTFTNGATAPAAVVGNVVLGYNVGTNRGTFINQFNTTTTATSTATYGLTGNVTGQGNVTIDNEGAWTGALVQTTVSAAGTSVSFTNGTKSNFTGVITTQDTTTLTNNATGLNAAGVGYAMLLGNGSALGTASSGSSLTNNGVLTIGTTGVPALVTIYGNFTQTGTNSTTGVTPVLNMAIVTGSKTAGAQSSGTTAGYSQIYALGGTASLGGILNVNVAAATTLVGSKYDLIVADQGITGSFSTVNVLNASGKTLPFIKFVQDGVVSANNSSLPNQQYYQFSVARVGTYATDIRSAGAGTPNQLAVATALNPIVGIADAATGSAYPNETALVGQIDQLTIAQATALFDELSPAGLVSYANALRDEANTLERQVWLRLGDQNSDHAEDGWWGSFNTQVDLGGTSVDQSKQTLFGFTGGFDLSGPHHVFGLAGSVMFDSLHNEGHTLTGHNRDFALDAYGGYNLGPIHFTGQLQYNFGRLSTNRTLNFDTTTATATGHASEGLFKGVATAGFMLHAGGYTFEPFGGIDYGHGHIHSFTETGDGAAALTVLPISLDRTDVLAGIALTRSHGKFRPYLRATFRDEIGGNSKDALVTAYFDGNTNTLFTVTGVPAAKHQGDLNAGVNWVFEDAGSLFVGYQGTIRSGYNAQGINLGIRLEF